MPICSLLIGKTIPCCERARAGVISLDVNARVGLFSVKSPTPSVTSRADRGSVQDLTCKLLVTLVINDTCSNGLDAEQVGVVDVVTQVVATVGAATESQ